jgi:hypothetical protein
MPLLTTIVKCTMKIYKARLFNTPESKTATITVTKTTTIT